MENPKPNIYIWHTKSSESAVVVRVPGPERRFFTYFPIFDREPKLEPKTDKVIKKCQMKPITLENVFPFFEKIPCLRKYGFLHIKDHLLENGGVYGKM